MIDNVERLISIVEKLTDRVEAVEARMTMHEESHVVHALLLTEADVALIADVHAVIDNTRNLDKTFVNTSVNDLAEIASLLDRLTGGAQ